MTIAANSASNDSSSKPRRRRAPTVAGEETINVSFKLPPDLVKRLDEMAVAEGRSRNSSVRIKLASIAWPRRKKSV